MGFVEHSRLAFDANPPAPEEERVRTKRARLPASSLPRRCFMRSHWNGAVTSILVLGAVLVSAGLARAESGLIAHWKLDESTGATAYDSSGSYMYCVAPASRALEGGES